jgi:hypothetical protein
VIALPTAKVSDDSSKIFLLLGSYNFKLPILRIDTLATTLSIEKDAPQKYLLLRDLIMRQGK